jgi:glycine/D-amino acid oxidase-like deaminating enzyme
MPEIVIVGGGIIGLCTAYYLLDSGADVGVTIIENVSVANGASSRAAGFIGGGSGWHKEANQALAALSWEAFEQLAKKLDGAKSYGYRHCAVTGVKVGTGQDEMHSYRQLPAGATASKTNRVPWYNGESMNLDTSGRAAQL